MGYGKAAQAYRENAVMGASPVQLVVMLYDGALRFMEEGKRAIESRDLETQNSKLQRAQKIVIELMTTLNFQQGGDIARSLVSLYAYVIGELVEGNMADDAKRIDNAMKTMKELRDSWVQVEKAPKGVQELTPNAA